MHTGGLTPSFTLSNTVVVGTRTWRITYFADQEFESARRTNAPHTLLGLLLLLVVIILIGACHCCMGWGPWGARCKLLAQRQ
jgi:hypothetical protein